MVRKWMPTWQAILRHVSFSVSSTVGPRGAGQAEGVQVLVNVPPTHITSTTSLPSLSYFYLDGGENASCILYKTACLKTQNKNPGSGVPESPRKLGTWSQSAGITSQNCRFWRRYWFVFTGMRKAKKIKKKMQQVC